MAFKHAIPLILTVALSSGCQSSPWQSARTPSDQALGATASAASPAGAAPATPPTTPAAPAGPQGQAMQEMLAQLEQLNDLDPATRQQVLEDLKKTDPRFWPDMIRQFRAVVAYRQQVQQREVERSAGSQQASNPPNRPAEPVAAQPSAAPGPARPAASAVANGPAGTKLEPPGKMPSASAIAEQAVASSSAPAPPAEGPAKKVDRQVVPTSYETPADPLRGDLEQAIRNLESRVSAAPQSPDQMAQHARLRMLYLLAGRREDALRPLPGASPSIQDFWSKELYGLATWMDARQSDHPERRDAETRQRLNEALDSLGHSAALTVRNMAFVTKADDFGIYRPFAEYKFGPGQEVLVYAEVENYYSEPTPTGYVTSLRTSYQIFDSRGQRVDESECKADDDDICRNPRRDFYICCRIFIPNRIYDGHHTLQLTVEDLKGKKIGQQSIEFTVVDPSSASSAMGKSRGDGEKLSKRQR